MNAYTEALEALRAMVAASQSVYSRCEFGAMPESDSLCMTVSGGAEKNVELGFGRDVELSVVINAKHVSQASAMEALWDIHGALCGSRLLPMGDGWQVLSASTTGAPCFLDRDAGQYLCGSGMRILIHFE